MPSSDFARDSNFVNSDLLASWIDPIGHMPVSKFSNKKVSFRYSTKYVIRPVVWIIGQPMKDIDQHCTIASAQARKKLGSLGSDYIGEHHRPCAINSRCNRSSSSCVTFLPASISA